ncbi:MAG: hypothetical protein Q4A60_03140 [Pasteurellaceae bacterium]|nr:hypothetical protein [Pasteurellaceae bacterium]
MEILYLVLRTIGILAFVLGIPLLLRYLAMKYLFKTKDWRVEAVLVFSLFGTFYAVYADDVSFLGYLDWWWVTILKYVPPLWLATYLNKRFFQNRWAYYVILFALFVINGLLVRAVLDYFGISMPKL